MKTIIHVNQHIIAHNRKTGENLPPLIVRTYKGSVNAHTIKVHGPCEIINSPHNPLDCGARVWIETQSEVSYS